MPRRRRSRRLVIDASVAGAAGASEHAVSKASRDFLQQVLKICHLIVVTPNILEEWKKHRSKFSSTWLVSMTARRKVAAIDVVESAELRSGIERASIRNCDRRAMRKDAHLIEAAFAADSTVVSADDAARRLFGALSADVGALKSVVWVNPGRQSERVAEWLGRGAKIVREWCLGAEPDL